jgi:tripeptide aminopeptidase
VVSEGDLELSKSKQASDTIDEPRAIGHLMDLLAIEGLSGREGQVARAIKKKLKAAGCKTSWMSHDKANEKIPGDYEIGNLIVKLPGTVKGPRKLFMGHMDTVPLCRGAVPMRKGHRIVSRGDTGLGGDNRTAVACLVTMVEELLEHNIPHPPITALFTVGEEVGLWGARMVKIADLGNPKLGFNIDSGVPADFVQGALGADRWEVHVHGRSSHAGVHPDHGISASLIASRAIADVAKQGYFGKIVKNGKRGTSNVGRIQGGEASNQVTDYVLVSGESRSHDPKFVTRITEIWRKAFERAARSVKNHKRQSGKVRFVSKKDYEPFRLDRNEPVVKHAMATARSIGMKPKLFLADGGLDANWLSARGLPTITFGAGQHAAHTVDEYVDVREYAGGCRLAVALARAD